MGCTASNSQVVTTMEPTVNKPTLAVKKPLPPIGASADTAKTGPEVARTKVDPLPDISVKTGKFTNNVAFEVTLDDNHIDNIVKRAPPKRLQRLAPITVTLTAEQLAEKQRQAEAKRDRMKQNIRLKSARSSRRRSELRKALEAAKDQEQPNETGATATATAQNAEEQRASSTPRPDETLVTSRLAQQVDKLPRLNEQPTQNDRPTDLDENTDYLLPVASTGIGATKGFSSARERPVTPLAPQTSRSDVIGDKLSVTAKAKQLNSEAEDEDADLGVSLRDNKPVAYGKQSTQLTSRLGSAESGFVSTANSASVAGKKPLQDSEIEAFKSARVLSPLPVNSPKTHTLDNDSASQRGRKVEAVKLDDDDFF